VRSQLLVDDNEDSLRALGLILAAWDEGSDNGVPPELMAYAALFTALTDLVALFGEEAVASMATGLVDRVNRGEFSLPCSAPRMM